MAIQTKAWGLLALGLLTAACSGTQRDGDSSEPPLSQEELAVRAQMERNTLAKIDLAQGEIRFVETEPGLVLIMRRFPIGAPLPRVAGEDNMTLDQIFHAYAPDRQVPQALFDAMSRGASANHDGDSEPAPQSPAMFEGQIPVAAAAPKADAVIKKSAVTDSAFLAKCSYGFVDWSWCYEYAYTGAWAQNIAHRGDALICGTNGGALVHFSVSGTVAVSFGVPYGECWDTGAYHGPHGAFGINLKRTLRWDIPHADDYVGFTGFTVNNDGFVTVGWY